MTKIQIKNRLTSAVIFEFEASDEQIANNTAMIEAVKAGIAAGADFSAADFSDAYFSGAKHVPDSIEATSPATPYQCDTRPLAERNAARAAKFRESNPDVPVIESLDAQILARIDADPNALDMSTWHSCETTHCRAGWAIAIAGEPGYELERKFGPHHAGRMIYLASTGRAPHFFGSNEAALADIKRCAAICSQAVSP